MRKAITKSELMHLRDKFAVIKLVDIRSAGEYQKLHVPDAINIPSEALETSLNSFSNNDIIVCVCNHGKERSQNAAEMVINSGKRSI